jgi:hypothetical protein
MLLSLITSLGLALLVNSAAVSRRATSSHITCYPDIVTGGTLYFSSPFYAGYTDKIGTLNIAGKVPFLTKYPAVNVKSLKVNVTPCSSNYLNYTVPTGCTTAHVPVLIYADDGSGDCIQLSTTSSTNAFVKKAACSTVDDAVQMNQFWTQTSSGSYYPTAVKQPATSYNLQFNQHSEVIANPHTCPAGKTCQDSTHIAFYIK